MSRFIIIELLRSLYCNARKVAAKQLESILESGGLRLSGDDNVRLIIVVEPRFAPATIEELLAYRKHFQPDIDEDLLVVAVMPDRAFIRGELADLSVLQALAHQFENYEHEDLPPLVH